MTHFLHITNRNNPRNNSLVLLQIVKQIINLNTVSMSGSILNDSHQNFSRARQHKMLEKLLRWYICDCLISCIHERLFRSKAKRFAEKGHLYGQGGDREEGRRKEVKTKEGNTINMKANVPTMY